MTVKYEVCFTDGLGNPRRWGLYSTPEKAAAGIARLRELRGITSGYVRLVRR